MSTYEFTNSAGHVVCRVRARTAAEAADQARALSAERPLLCSHMSDDPSPVGLDPIFYYGPDAVEA